MKVSQGQPKTQRVNLAPFIDKEKDRSLDQNPTFTNTFLKQQVFFKPQSDRIQSHENPWNKSDGKIKLGKKTIPSAMANSFTSTYSHNNQKNQKRQDEDLRKMIVKLSHQLLVKDSMIANLESELVCSQVTPVSQPCESGSRHPKQAGISRAKGSYHFKNLVEYEPQFQLGEQEGQGKLSYGESQFEDRYECMEEEKQRLQGRILNKSATGNTLFGQMIHTRSDSSKPQMTILRNERKQKNLINSVALKDKQLQIALDQKKLLASKVSENQRIITSREAEIKVLKGENRRISSNTWEGVPIGSQDSKQQVNWEDRVNKLKREVTVLNIQLDEAKKSKEIEIENSTEEWKRINQTVTDSFTKLSQENTALTKKLSDLDVKHNMCSAKVVELQKQNNTLKSNLENEKNSYSTLSLHHKHQKDQSSRKCSIIEKEAERWKSKWEGIKDEGQKLRVLLTSKEDSLQSIKAEMMKTQLEHREELGKLIEQYTKQRLEYQRVASSHGKEVKHIESMQRDLKSEREQKLASQKHLAETKLKLQQTETLRAIQVGEYKSQIIQLIQKVTGLSSSITSQLGAEEDVCIGSQNYPDSMDMSASNECQNADQKKQSLAEEENKELKRIIMLLNQQIEGLKAVITSLKLGGELKESPPTNRTQQVKILQLEEQLAQSRRRQQEFKDFQLNIDDFNAVVDHNRQLTHGIHQRDDLIKQFRHNLRLQQNNTISLKLSLDEANKRLLPYMELLEAANANLIRNQLELGNTHYESEQTIFQLKSDNDNLEEELKIIYQKLEYFEARLQEQNSGTDEI